MFFEHVYVDMDGVLCDLSKGMLAAHGRMELHPAQEYITGATLGITHKELWAPIVEIGAAFWVNLEPYPWMYELLDFVSKISREVTVLTRPLVAEGCSWDFYETGLCVEGKLQWLREYVGGMHVVFTDKKNTVSKPGTLLIDDDESYEDAFIQAGGRQFIWPQPYNRYAQYIGVEMPTLKAWYNRLQARTS